MVAARTLLSLDQATPDFDVGHILEAGKLSAAADGLEIVVRRQGAVPQAKFDRPSTGVLLICALKIPHEFA
jgi:hypothetical protein